MFNSASYLAGMATDTLSRVTKQTFHRAPPDRLAEEPSSLSLSKAPNKRVMFRRPQSRTLYAYPRRAVKQLLVRGARRRSEAPNSPFLGRAACFTYSPATCSRACVLPTQPLAQRPWLGGHFGNDCSLLASNCHADAARFAKKKPFTCKVPDGKMPHKWWIFRHVTSFSGGFLP